MVAEKFNFLFPGNFVKLDVAQIKEATLNIVRAYGDDFESDDLETEVRSFQIEFLDELNSEDVTSVSSIMEIIYKARVASSFPQLCKLLLLFLDPDHSRDSSVSRKVLFKAEDYQMVPEEFHGTRAPRWTNFNFNRKQ